MNKPRAFCEFPAGLAAVSLYLHGGKHCRPPISRMGNKAGYSAVICDALGLTPGQGASAYLWAEADPDVRALLRAYPDAAMLRKIAEIIRGWADEEPRALWERLRAERKARGPAEGSDVAGWCWLQARSVLQKGPESGYMPGGDEDGSGRWVPTQSGISDACTSLAAYAQIVASNRLIHVAGPELRNTGVSGTTFGGAEFATPAADVAEGFERVGVSIASRWPPVAVLPAIPSAADVAAWLGTPGDLDGVVVLSDPPYQNTTGYAHDLPRADVVRHALDFATLGAVVCVCEQEPIPELMAAGWYEARITNGRKGQRRTFSRQSEEYLTINRPPHSIVAEQIGMFT